MYNENGLLVGGPIGLKLKTFLKDNLCSKLNIVHLPDEAAANCIFVNGVLIRRTAEEFPLSEPFFKRLEVERQIQVRASELALVDGALTCCALLV